MGLTTNAIRLVREQVAGWTADADQETLNGHLRLLALWRSKMLANTYVQREGPRIWGGPFAGMDYVRNATEGALIPRLLGTYESELHPHLEAFAAEGLECVIDVGCAEGYYAVGLARMMPQVEVHAFDIDPKARTACAELAQRNGVADRVRIGGEFSPDGFEAFAGRRVLVMVDAEGAEVDILQPDLSPALRGMSIIVETHDLYRRNALATMMARFSPSHDIVREDLQAKTVTGPPWLMDMPQLDQLLAVWEWRQRQTPWLVMRPKTT
ncbi:methyltransferase domain-containing protein [Phenylobacterium sp.]|uniref:methyltransferase domain-containing protein n=1 Tax=Phenylobacterium sp. TaxID=1871053 RepID=UPI00301CB6AD